MSQRVILLRGTNGAGKSTIVRAIMKLYDECITHERSGRRRPLGYYCHTNSGFPHQLYIPGHYEIANGGIDTIKSLEEVFQNIWEAYDNGYSVLFEGKNMQDGTVALRATELFSKEQMAFIHVNTPVDVCIHSVRQRGHSIAEKTILSIAKRIPLVTDGLTMAGYECFTLSREDALAKVKELLQ